MVIDMNDGARCPAAGPTASHALDAVTDAHDPALHDARRDAAVPPHGVEATSAQQIFHLSARRTLAGGLKNTRADAKSSLLERNQVDAADDEIPAQQVGCYLRSAEKRSDSNYVFLGNQCRLPRPIVGTTVAVAVYAATCDQARLGARHHWRMPGRPKSYPDEHAWTHWTVQQTLER